MRKQIYKADTLKTLLLKDKIATMHKLKKALKTSVDMTVLRKLTELSYLTSYSHSGRYYTLAEIPKYDENGIWVHQNVYFSQHNTLIDTLCVLITDSVQGYSKNELEKILNTRVQEQLFQLYQNKLVRREKMDRQYIYFASDVNNYRQQKSNRHDFPSSTLGSVYIEEDILAHELKAAVILFFSILDEQQRRLYAGLESLKLGYGGDKKISEFLLVDPQTVARGRKELLGRDIDVEHIRKKGGGRYSAEKKHQK